jgi:hypothetical protein
MLTPSSSGRNRLRYLLFPRSFISMLPRLVILLGGSVYVQGHRNGFEYSSSYSPAHPNTAIG